MTKLAIADATDDEINAEIARREGCIKDQHDGITAWIDKNGEEHIGPPDYLHDAALCFKLPLPNCVIVIVKGLPIEIMTCHYGKHKDDNLLRAWCLAYLAYIEGKDG